MTSGTLCPVRAGVSVLRRRFCFPRQAHWPAPAGAGEVNSHYREIYQSQMSPINCYTCHRGQIQPVTLPPATANILPKFDDKPLEIKSSASLPSVDQVLAKYVQALGGQVALEKVTTRVMKGAMVTPGFNAPLEVYEKAPNKTLTTFRTPSGTSFMGFNGTVGATWAFCSPCIHQHRTVHLTFERSEVILQM